MKPRHLALAASLMLFSSLAAQAELIATPLTGDSRLVQFNFDEDNTFLVLTKPKAVTHIQFAADEMVQSVAAGDTAQWELTPTKNRKNLFIKPRYESLETSMTIITDKRTYQFVLRSTGDGRKWYQRVSWLYPGSIVLEQDAVIDSKPAPGASAAREGMAPPAITAPQMPQVSMADTATGPAIAAEGLRPEALRFGYAIEGDAPFKPVMVFDDGRFTYLRMPANLQEMPALFAVLDGQDYSLVNYIIKGEYMVVQRLLESAVLKLGKREIKVSKTKPKTGFFGFSNNESN